MFDFDFLGGLICAHAVRRIHNDGLNFTGTVATMFCRSLVFIRFKAGNGIFEGWKFNNNKALEIIRALHHLKFAASRQWLAAVFFQNIANQRRVF